MFLVSFEDVVAGKIDGNDEVHEVYAAAGCANLCVGLAAGGPLEAFKGEGGDIILSVVVLLKSCFFLLCAEIWWEVRVDQIPMLSSMKRQRSTRRWLEFGRRVVRSCVP